MSSEHVEVLRDLSEVCRAAIKAGDWKVDGACDPDAALRRADAALASLSAPQPPAEAQPVAWQFQDRKGNWHEFIDERHRLNTIEDGSWPIRALYAHPPPSAPVGVVGLVRDLVLEIERNTCAHEDTYRGGAIWEICDACGAEWADDRGGKPDFKWPDCVERARAWLAQQPAAEVYVDFPQVGTAGPLAVVDGKVTLPDTTMNDLIRHARTGYVEQPAAVDGAARRRDVRLWMRHNVDSYSTATELAEAADVVFNLPDGGLDNETHWVWDEAAEAVNDSQRGGLA